MFHEVDIVGLIHYVTFKGQEVIPLVNHFNRVSGWVSTEIVIQPNLRKRAFVLRRFVNLAEKLLELQNYNGFLEVLAGLSNVSVARLKKTWKASKAKRRVNELEVIMDNRKNYSNYRQRLKESTGAQLPYFGVYLRDLTITHVGNELHIKNSQGQDLVNMEKFYLMHKITHDLEHYQQLTYNIQEDARVAHLLQNLEIISDENLYQQSLLCEPTQEW